MVGKQVLPTTFNVYCDPTLRHYAGVDMNGSYRYDDEGAARPSVRASPTAISSAR